MGEKDLDACTNKFIEYSLKLITAVCEKNRNNEVAADLREKFSIIRKEIPHRIVELAGPYLWKERKNISPTINVQYFLSDDFLAKMQTDAADIPEVCEFTDFAQLHKITKHTWQCSQEAEREVLKKYVQGLLIEYAKYVKVTKVGV